MPGHVVEAAMAAAPPSLQQNLNRLVIVSLEEFTSRRRALAFEKSMEEMAADPAIRQECQTIAHEFAVANADGLQHD